MIITNKTALENWAMAQLMCINNRRDIYYLDVPKNLYKLEDDEYDIQCLPLSYWEDEEYTYVGICIEVHYEEDDTSFSYHKNLKAKVCSKFLADITYEE